MAGYFPAILSWVVEMVYVCDNCHFVFSRTAEIEQCPDCGKYMIRTASEEEKRQFEETLAESRKHPL